MLGARNPDNSRCEMTHNEARDELRRILLLNENDEFLDVEIPGALAKLRRKKSRALAWKIATTLFHDQLGKLNWSTKLGVNLIDEVLSWGGAPPRQFLRDACVWIIMYYEQLSEEAEQCQSILEDGEERTRRITAARLRVVLESYEFW